MRELLYKMLKTPSPSGSELAIQKMIINEMKNVSDTVITHHNFNVINVINPESPTKILLCGHVDEVGLYIEKVLNDGTCRLARAGGVRPQVYIGQHVRVITQNGKEVYGVIGYTPNMEKLKVTDLLLDLGTTSKEDTLKLIEIGDPVVHITDYTELNNNCLAGRALDDKLGAYIILETLRKVKEQGTKLGAHQMIPLD